MKEVPKYFVIYDKYRRTGWKTREELDNLQEQKRVKWAKHEDNRKMEWGTDGAVEIIDRNTVEIGGKEDKLKTNL
jgi:hypothetical protein